MTASEARAFAETWLPAWTGNHPETLVEFYADDVLYLDPAVPQGIRGKTSLLAYFRKLLAKNPDWIWRQLEAIPLESGFLNKWEAYIPLGNAAVTIVGVCFVQIDAAGKIFRNESQRQSVVHSA